jgi:hypothetical protein
MPKAAHRRTTSKARTRKRRIDDALSRSPFISDTRSDGRPGRWFWSVEATEDYTADCERGGVLANQLLKIAEVGKQQDDVPVLGWIVHDMIAQGRFSGPSLPSATEVDVTVQMEPEEEVAVGAQGSCLDRFRSPRPPETISGL